MSSRSEGHTRVNFQYLFSRLSFIVLPCRLYNYGLADLCRFEVLLPFIFPAAVIAYAHFNGQRSQIRSLTKNSGSRRALQSVNRMAQIFRGGPSVLIVIHVHCYLRLPVPELKNAFVHIVPVVLVFLV